jgi:hypothetical protein
MRKRTLLAIVHQAAKHEVLIAVDMGSMAHLREASA